MSKDINNEDFTLLSQEEIDTLVTFLTANNASISGDVLNQESVDKLIALIRNGLPGKQKNLFDFPDIGLTDTLSAMGFRNDSKEVCTLTAAKDADGFLVLTITNTANNQTMSLTPETTDHSQADANWGFSMAPVMFSKLARTYGVRFTQETYDFICHDYAERNYGSKDAAISSVYLPTNAHLLRSLM